MILGLILSMSIGLQAAEEFGIASYYSDAFHGSSACVLGRPGTSVCDARHHTGHADSRRDYKYDVSFRVPHGSRSPRGRRDRRGRERSAAHRNG